MLTNLKNVMINEDGASLVEYALLVALIAAVAITALTTMGTKITALLNSVSVKLAPAP